jgi:hypothetical protein
MTGQFLTNVCFISFTALNLFRLRFNDVVDGSACACHGVPLCVCVCVSCPVTAQFNRSQYVVNTHAHLSAISLYVLSTHYVFWFLYRLCVCDTSRMTKTHEGRNN